MKVYVSGPSADLSWCKRVTSDLLSDGHVITYDWTRCFGPSPVELDFSAIAKAEYDAILKSNLMLLLHNRRTLSVGKWVELGIAMSNDIPILAVGKTDEDLRHLFDVNPFVHGAAVMTVTDPHLPEFLTSYRERQMAC